MSAEELGRWIIAVYVDLQVDVDVAAWICCHAKQRWLWRQDGLHAQQRWRSCHAVSSKELGRWIVAFHFLRGIVGQGQDFVVHGHVVEYRHHHD